MALQIFGTDSIGAGIRANLLTTDSVFVSAGATLGSVDDVAISGTGSYHSVNIQGTVIGGYRAITLGDDAAADVGQRLVVGSNGYVGSMSGGNRGVIITGSSSSVENDGTIYSNANSALELIGTNAVSQSTVINAGTINGRDYGITHAGSETLILENSGTIKSSFSSYSDIFGSIDQITNTGKMIGAVSLGAGADIFDTRLGTLSGALDAGAGADKLYGSALADKFSGGDDADNISGFAGDDQLDGGNGNDSIAGGLGADTLIGGVGIDRVFYSASTTGVTVSLQTASLNTGEAKGDTFSSIENLTGSNFNDSLFGNSGANAISGGTGNDIIKGYGGLDSLTGGAGNDTFVFDTALNATTNVDTITDYNVVADTIQLENAIFTTLTATGVLAATAFVKNTAGVAADSSDRIIYETDTGKLFYDQDGNGAAFAGIQFAKLAPGLALTNADFFII